MNAESSCEPGVVTAPLIQGYVDEITSSSISGWLRDGNDPNVKLWFDVAIILPDSKRTLIRNLKADLFCAALSSFGDRKYGFKVELPEALTTNERDHLVVLPFGLDAPLERAETFQGYVDERSVNHVAGWVRNRFNHEERVMVEVVSISPNGEHVIARGEANQFRSVLAHQLIGDACYGFRFVFEEPVSERERDAIIVRPSRNGKPLELAPNLITTSEIINFVAIDIVNNCNLRCPFCLFNYAQTRTTKYMSDEIFDSALRLLPYVHEAGFWLSCLHEPSLNPNFLRFIDRVPLQWRHKLMFTTNLAKRMPDSYYEALANSGVYHINLSLESLTPHVYEKFRKGARWRIFQENWDRLVMAWKGASTPPRLRYIAMAYKSNLAEIPSLVKYLREERLAWQIEIRHTFDVAHIPADFAASEYLEPAEWGWLVEQLACYPAGDVLVAPPPASSQSPTNKAASAQFPSPDVVLGGPSETFPLATQATPPGSHILIPEMPLNMSIEWDGEVIISDKMDDSRISNRLAVTNIKEMENPLSYLAECASRPVPTSIYAPDARPLVQGFVDSITETEIVGWIRNGHDPSKSVHYEVLLVSDLGDKVVAQGVADQFCSGLANAYFNDHKHGFTVTLPVPLTADERNRLVVRDRDTRTPLKRAPKVQGFINARSSHHIAGWIRDAFDPDQRVTFNVILPHVDGDEILWHGIADQRGWNHLPCGFHVLFARPLSETERDSVQVWPLGSNSPLELSPRLVTSF